MKNLISLLIICLFVISCTSDSSEQNEIQGEITNKQNEFAEQIMENPIVVKAVWTTNVQLDVYYDTDILEKKPKNDNHLVKAKITADTIAEAGFKDTGKDICVYIFNGTNPKSITSSCVKHEESLNFTTE